MYDVHLRNSKLVYTHSEHTTNIRHDKVDRNDFESSNTFIYFTCKTKEHLLHITYIILLNTNVPHGSFSLGSADDAELGGRPVTLGGHSLSLASRNR